MRSIKIGEPFQVVLVGWALLLCYAVAAAQDVRYNYLQDTEFSKYKSYKWVHIPGAQYPNQILDGQIKQLLMRNCP